MDQIKASYRHFLNSSAGRYLEPNSLVSPLVKAKILSKEEGEIVKNEPTRAKRQYQLFLKILPMKGKKLCKETDYIIKGLRLMDTHTLMEVYKDQTSVKDFLKLLKQKSKDKSAEKKEKKKLSLDVTTDGHLAAVSTSTDTEPTSPAVTPTFEFDDEEDDGSPFSRLVGDLPGYSGQPTNRAMSEPGTDIFAIVDDAGASRSMSTEEKVKDASIDPNDLELGPLIGSGGFAIVYIGRYKSRKVAVKMFRDYDAFTLTMFYDEVNIMKSLNHDNVLEFVGFHNETQKKKLWLITEFVDGGSMRRFCKRPKEKDTTDTDDSGLTLDKKLYIATCCWNGLDYLHKQNVCHKDISPDNILISEDLSSVKISDFGLAEIKQLMTTAVTQISGTPMYYPPEYASENGILRHPVKSDVYSMGASLCELFSGQWFWNDSGMPKNHFQVLFMLSEQRKSVEEHSLPKDPSCWNFIPEPVQKILTYAIDADYTNRKSAAELYDITHALLQQVVKKINDE